ncbi:MAG: endonuclease/exonuclease/phosphatase family protein [Planctomycetales bacterium]|nr:endonuclease/exonuclease/phosphatase family protein [Planctomycetales bacterium]
MVIATRLATGFIFLATVLPFLSVGTWWIRLCDFPRMHIGAAALVPSVLLSYWSWRNGPSLEPSLLIALCTSMAFWQFSHLLPYTPVWRKELPDARPNDAAHTLSVVNLKFENDKKVEVLKQLQALDSDLLLLIEFDQAWSDGLAPLKDRYAYREGAILEEGLGLVFWSKLPLIEPEVRYLVSEKRPSIFSKVELSDGRIANFVGVHPTPPGLWDKDKERRHDSRIRDAELLIIADLVAKHPTRDWIISGDFNDVAWSHTTRLFQRTSGLKDPRVGRGLYTTYHAKYPPFRVPIDQVFLSPTACILRLERLKPAGSDHFAITTAFYLEGQERSTPNPEGNDLEQAEKMIDEGLRDADEEGE